MTPEQTADEISAIATALRALWIDTEHMKDELDGDPQARAIVGSLGRRIREAQSKCESLRAKMTETA